MKNTYRRVFIITISLSALVGAPANVMAGSSVGSPDISAGYFSSRGAYNGPPADVVPGTIVERTITSAEVIPGKNTPTPKASGITAVSCGNMASPTLMLDKMTYGRLRNISPF